MKENFPLPQLGAFKIVAGWWRHQPGRRPVAGVPIRHRQSGEAISDSYRIRWLSDWNNSPRLSCFFLFIFFLSCNSNYTSKKEGYFKIDFPKKVYTTFNEAGYPYTFEYPVYAKIAKDSSYFDEGAKNPYWINIVFPSFNGTIFISYKKIGGTSVYKIKNPDGIYRDSIGKNSFEKMVNDSYNLTYKNDVKAYSIEDSVMHTPNNVTGVFFKLSGNVATAKQFFLTDTLHHFLRGALYFDATPNEDSLRPVNEFLQQDMKHLINTLKWK